MPICGFDGKTKNFSNSYFRHSSPSPSSLPDPSGDPSSSPSLGGGSSVEDKLKALRSQHQDKLSALEKERERHQREIVEKYNQAVRLIHDQE